MAEPKEQELGEWQTNPFAHPEVLGYVQQLKDKISQLDTDMKMEIVANQEAKSTLEWIKESYPSIIEQYKAICDIARAEYEAKHKFFGEIK